MSDTREALASYAHSAWAGWMSYLFEKSVAIGDGTMLIPAPLVERWPAITLVVIYGPVALVVGWVVWRIWRCYEH